MDIEALFNEAKAKILAGKHPLISVDASIKYAYLTGLAIIAVVKAKDDFTEVEKEYLDAVAYAIDLSPELYQKALLNGKKPDVQLIEIIVETINQTYMQFFFLIDAWQLSKIDGTVNEKENRIIESYIQFFKFNNDNCQLLENLMSAIEKNDIENFNLSINEVIGIEKNMIKDILKYYFSEEETEKYLKEFELKEQFLKENADKEKKLKEELVILHEQQNKIAKDKKDIIKKVMLLILLKKRILRLI
ncbi:MAG: hypothetical protein QMC67_10265 [Candidatus Wallbacteria bacterium]